MEIGEISTTQSYSNRLDIDNNKISSHTPVTTITTTISGLKNLRGRKNLLKDNYHQSSSSSSSATAAVITPPSTTSSSSKTTPPRSFERVTFKTYHDDDDEDEDEEDEDEDDEEIRMKQKNIHKNYPTGRKVPTITSTITNNIINNKQNDNVYQSVITEHVSSFPQLNTINSNQEQSSSIIDNYIMSSSTNNKTTSSTTTITTTTTPSSLSMNKNHDPLDLSDITNPTTSNETKSFQSMNNKIINNIPNSDLLNINEDAHSCPLSNVFEFDGLQILVPSTFISESSQKAISATSQQSMASSEGGGGVGIDEEIKSVNMRADETMPPRGELSEQESNGCTEIQLGSYMLDKNHHVCQHHMI
ncbi:hypothetical protein HCN44_010638 [Aphidius gifuensis]|uniref:Uncharacterized protein n=1 Tax=Aphidius gifuensis TaxID=684658 RepID=A0A834XUG4_APHGI|nr:hypothetical protein HCN44_010638 [Aphidius gifuensis]